MTADRHTGVPGWVKAVVAILLIALVAFALFMIIGGDVAVDTRAPAADIDVAPPNIDVNSGNAEAEVGTP